MQEEHALPEDRTGAQARQRRQLIVTSVAVFLVALLIGLWTGGNIFAS